MSTRQEVFDAIDREREYQDRKWGALDTYRHNTRRWASLAAEEVDEAIEAWSTPEHARAELLQAAAVIVAALEQLGVVEAHE